MPGPLRAIFFDLDNTLLDHSSATRSAFHHIHDRYSGHFPGIDAGIAYKQWVAINDRYWHDYSAGLLSPPELKLGRMYSLLAWARGEELARDGQTDALATEITDIYLDLLIAGSVPYDGVLPMLEHLRGRYQLGIISNGFSHIQRERLKTTSLSGIFDHVILSEEVGMPKPDPGIFQAALDAAGVTASETLYIGDNFFCDIGGASSVGIRTIWFNPLDHKHPTDPPDIRPDAVARSIPDLARLLGIPLDLTSSL